jgi:hypothetical protein
VVAQDLPAAILLVRNLSLPVDLVARAMLAHLIAGPTTDKRPAEGCSVTRNTRSAHVSLPVTVNPAGNPGPNECAESITSGDSHYRWASHNEFLRVQWNHSGQRIVSSLHKAEMGGFLAHQKARI